MIFGNEGQVTGPDGFPLFSPGFDPSGLPTPASMDAQVNRANQLYQDLVGIIDEQLGLRFEQLATDAAEITHNVLKPIDGKLASVNRRIQKAKGPIEYDLDQRIADLDNRGFAVYHDLSQGTGSVLPQLPTSTDKSPVVLSGKPLLDSFFSPSDLPITGVPAKPTVPIGQPSQPPLTFPTPPNYPGCQVYNTNGELRDASWFRMPPDWTLGTPGQSPVVDPPIPWSQCKVASSSSPYTNLVFGVAGGFNTKTGKCTLIHVTENGYPEDNPIGFDKGDYLVITGIGEDGYTTQNAMACSPLCRGSGGAQPPTPIPNPPTTIGTPPITKPLPPGCCPPPTINVSCPPNQPKEDKGFIGGDIAWMATDASGDIITKVWDELGIDFDPLDTPGAVSTALAKSYEYLDIGQELENDEEPIE